MTLRRFAAAVLALGAVGACGSATDTATTTDAGRDVNSDVNSDEGGSTCPPPEKSVPIAYRPCVDGGPDASAGDANDDARPADAAPPLLCSNDCTGACKQLATGYGTVSSCTENGPTDAGQAAATCHVIPPCPL